MLSRKKILSAMAGLAMLAMPVSALAGHKNDRNNPRPYAGHDQGFHNGWAKHQFAAATPMQYGHRDYAEPRVAPNWYGHHENRDYYRRSGNDWEPAPQPSGWNHGWDRNYQCDADGDNCNWANNNGSQYWNNNGGYNYGAPYSWYQEQAPTGYGQSQQLGWLMSRRQRAMATIAQMRARGDSRGAARMVSVVNALNRRIASLNGGYRGYNSYNNYAPAAAYAPPINNYGSPFTSMLGGASAPYYGNSNQYGGNPNAYYGNTSQYGGSNGYYGNNSAYYGNSPTTNALVSMLPLLLGTH